MKYALSIFSFSAIFSLNAVEFKVHNGLKDPVILSFDIYSDKAEFEVPYHIMAQSFTIAPGKTEMIKPKLVEAGKVFSVSTIFVKSKKLTGSSSYYIDEDKRNKNLLIKLMLGKAVRLTATGPVEVPGPVFDVVQVIK